MAKKILILDRRAPYGTVFAVEGFLAGIAMRSMDMPTDLVLVDDGVWCAVKGQQPEVISQNSVCETFASCDEYGLKLSVHARSLEERGVERTQLIDAAVIDDDALDALVESADAIMTF